MNIAFSTFVLFVLFIPGVAFRKGFLADKRAKKIPRLSALDDFINAIIPGVFLQLSFSWIVNHCPFIGVKVSYIEIGMLLNPKEGYLFYEHQEKYVGYIILYNTILIFCSWLLGVGLRLFIVKCKIDLIHPMTRFTNEWHYLLEGKTSKFMEFNSKKKFTDWISFYMSSLKDNNKFITRLAIVVRADDKKSYIYSGMLYDYHFNKEGQLDILVINSVLRKPFENSSEVNLSVAEKFNITSENKVHHTHVVILNYRDVTEIGVSILSLGNINNRTQQTVTEQSAVGEVKTGETITAETGIEVKDNERTSTEETVSRLQQQGKELSRQQRKKKRSRKQQ